MYNKFKIRLKNKGRNINELEISKMTNDAKEDIENKILDGIIIYPEQQVQLEQPVQPISQVTSRRSTRSQSRSGGRKRKTKRRKYKC